jgi:RNA polymerase sigma-70 factor (ECF subfamily)
MVDIGEFENTATPHVDAVYRTAFALCGRGEKAEDLTQDTFAKALERFGSFRLGTNCKAWLLRILRNTWIDELRHMKVVGPQVAVDEAVLSAPEHVEETAWTSAADILDNFSDEEVIRAMKQLPDEQRLAVFLSDVERLSHGEIAEITDVAVGTVKSRTSRARIELRRTLLIHVRDLGFLERKP